MVSSDSNGKLEELEARLGYQKPSLRETVFVLGVMVHAFSVWTLEVEARGL